MVNVYKIMLSGAGDWLVSDGKDTWWADYSIDKATAFETHPEASKFIAEYQIRHFWPQANIQIVAIEGEYRG